MPHQCVRCGKLHKDGSKELLAGCDCGSKFFFFIKKEDMNKPQLKLSEEERTQIEKDVVDIVGANIDTSKPVFLDLESINILKPGQYEIDLVDLFKGKPLVYKLESGKYVIDLVSTFEKAKKAKING